MDGTTASLWASLATALGALAWVLVRRLRQAKRVMPRAHFQWRFSLRTPETDPPPEKKRRHRRELLSLEPPALSEPPIELEASDLEDDEQRRPSHSDRPTPTKKRRYTP